MLKAAPKMPNSPTYLLVSKMTKMSQSPRFETYNDNRLVTFRRNPKYKFYFELNQRVLLVRTTLETSFLLIIEILYYSLIKVSARIIMLIM